MSTHHHFGLTSFSFWNTRSGPFKLPLPLGTLQRLPPNCLDGQSSIPRVGASRESNHTPLLLQPSATGAALNFVLTSETPFGFCGIVCGTADLKYCSSNSYSSGPTLKEGSVRVLPSSSADEEVVVVVGLGKDDPQREESERENRDTHREKIRTAISAGVRALQSMTSLIFNPLSNL